MNKGFNSDRTNSVYSINLYTSSRKEKKYEKIIEWIEILSEYFTLYFIDNSDIIPRPSTITIRSDLSIRGSRPKVRYSVRAYSSTPNHDRRDKELDKK